MRLVISYSRGKSGKRYPYYFCVGRQQKRTTCQLTYRPLDLVEQQIEEHYQLVQLSAEGIDQTGRAIVEEISDQQTDVAEEGKRQQTKLRQLENEQLILMQAHYAGAVPLELLKTEQNRISDELVVAQTRFNSSQLDLKRIEQTVTLAGSKARNCHASYLAADAHTRRLMNQAFFTRIWVTEDGVVGWQYHQPIGTLMSAHGANPLQLPPNLTNPGKPDEQQADNTSTRHQPNSQARHQGYQRQRPSQLAGALTLVRCSKEEHLAEWLHHLSNPPETFKRLVKMGVDRPQGKRAHGSF